MRSGRVRPSYCPPPPAPGSVRSPSPRVHGNAVAVWGGEQPARSGSPQPPGAAGGGDGQGRRGRAMPAGRAVEERRRLLCARRRAAGAGLAGLLPGGPPPRREGLAAGARQ